MSVFVIALELNGANRKKQLLWKQKEMLDTPLPLDSWPDPSQTVKAKKASCADLYKEGKEQENELHEGVLLAVVGRQL